MPVDAKRGEQRIERRIVGAVHVTVKKRMHVTAGKFADQSRDIVFADADSRLPVALPKRTHDVVE